MQQVQIDTLDRRNVRTVFFQASALLFAVLTAILPNLAELHLAYASHQHRFNPDTGLYEDVILIAGTPRPENKAALAENSGGSIGSERYYTINYTTCLTSNLFILRYTVSLESLSFSEFIDGQYQNTTYRDPQFTSISALSRAPKTSPPFRS